MALSFKVFWAEIGNGRGLLQSLAASATAFKGQTAAAMRAAELAVKNDLRAQMAAAGISKRLQNTIRSQTWPKAKPSAAPRAAVWSKAPKILAGMRFAGVIRPVRAGGLVIPLPAAPRGRGGRAATLDEVVKRFGRPRPVRGPRGLVLLFRARKLKSGRFGRSRGRSGEWVAMYVVVKEVRAKRKLDVQKALLSGGAAFRAKSGFPKADEDEAA